MKKLSKLAIILLIIAMGIGALNACYLMEKSYTITFDTAEGSVVEPITAKEASLVQAPADPTREHYTFEGWYSNDNKKVEFPYALFRDVTFTAKWTKTKYTITFDIDGGTHELGDGGALIQNLESGDDATLPNDPKKTGYSFLGWDPAPNLEGVTASATYTAQWGEPVQRLEFVKISGEEEYEVKYDPSNDAQVIVIPSTYEGLPVTKIANHAFNGWSLITSVTIPEGVTTIGDSAFLRCSNLTSITIPSSVTSIGSAAFSGCASLTSVTIPAGITTISSSMFYDCIALTSITIPSSVTSIGLGAFSSCIKLTDITIPSSVTSIGNSAFKGCTKLEEITISSGVQTIAISAFENCSAVEEIVIPDSVTSIGLGAFKGCSKLFKITIPFAGQSKDATSTTEFNYDTNFGYIFGVKDPVNHYQVVPSTLKTVIVGGTSIADKAFYGCGYLTLIEIGDTVTSIGNNVFESCSDLRVVKIGSGVISIGQYCFNWCPSLSEVIFSDTDEWHVKDSLDLVGGPLVNVTEKYTNATHFYTTYKAYFWYKV